MGELTGQLLDGLAAGEAQVAGTVRVSAPESLASGVLAPRLPELRARHPELRLEVSVSAAAANLSQREADLALRLFRPAEPSLVARRFGRFGMGLYAHRDYLRAHGRPTLETLSKHELLGYDDSLKGTPHGQWLAEAVPNGSFALRTNSTYALLIAAKHAAGVALLPCFLGEGERSLVPLVGPDVVRSPELWLVFHERRRAIPRLRVAIDFVRDALEASREAIEGRTVRSRPSGRSRSP